MATRPSQARVQRAATAKPTTPAQDVMINDYGVPTEHRKCIDGCNYTTVLYPAEEGFAHLTFLSKCAAGPLSVVVSGLGSFVGLVNQGADQDLPAKDVGNAILDLVIEVEQAGGAAKIQDLLRYTQVQVRGEWRKVSDDFNAWSQGRYLHMLKVVAWVVEVNLVPFGAGVTQGLMSRLTDLLTQFSSKLDERPRS